MKRFLSLLLAVAMLLSVSLSFAEETTEHQLLATVNGVEIYDDNSDMNDLISYYTSYYSYYGYDTTDESFTTYLKDLGLEWAIEAELYHQQATALGLALTDEEIAAYETEAHEYWASQLESYESSVLGITDSSTAEEKLNARATALSVFENDYGYTEDSYVEEYVLSSISNALITKVQEVLFEALSVTEEDLIAYFNELVEEDKTNYEGNISYYEYATQYYGTDSYYKPEGYKGIIHILLTVDDDLLSNYQTLSAALEEQNEATESDAETTTETAAEGEATAEATAEPVTQEQVDAAYQAIMDSVQPTIDEIMAKYNAGTSFADLVLEYGTDPGMTTETVTTGYEVHPDSIMFVETFTDAAAALENIGDMTGPVLSTYGVHILYYLRDIPGGAVDMTEEIREELESDLLSEEKSTITSDALDQWTAAADIQYTEAGQAILDAAAAMSAE